LLVLAFVYFLQILVILDLYWFCYCYKVFDQQWTFCHLLSNKLSNNTPMQPLKECTNNSLNILGIKNPLASNALSIKNMSSRDSSMLPLRSKVIPNSMLILHSLLSYCTFLISRNLLILVPCRTSSWTRLTSRRIVETKNQKYSHMPLPKFLSSKHWISSIVITYSS
jgi:hypothetical protein